MRLVIVGNSGFTHVGESFRRAAEELGHQVLFCDVGAAYRGPQPWRTFNWRFRGRRPVHLASFSATVVAAAGKFRAEAVVTTGMAPLRREDVERIRQGGSRILNFSTDDPWNRVHRAPWFLDALPAYDVVFTPRHANLQDFRRLGCPSVAWLPFAYDPRHCFPETLAPEEHEALGCDVLVVGGADRDRLPIATALARNGFDLALYGLYWSRAPGLRRYARGSVDAATIRRATRAAKIAVCMVRRANRDGHVMRSFEIPAIGACMVVENTEDHREIFGEAGESVEFFDGVDGLVAQVHALLGNPERRRALADKCHARIVSQPNTYRDRLEAMLLATGEDQLLEHCK